jgi:ribosomal protein S18 acetylase RimI-like enzyme
VIYGLSRYNKLLGTQIMIRHAEITDLYRVKSFDPFYGERSKDVEEKRVFVYLEGGLACGYISMTRGGLLGRPYLQYLAIDSSFQRMGIGYKLLEYVEEVYCAERLFISTESDNIRM